MASAHQLVPTRPTRTDWVIGSVWQGSAEQASIEVDERLADLLIRVHHERTVASDGLADRTAGHENDLGLRAGSSDRQLVTVDDCEHTLVDIGVADAERARHRVRQHGVI